MQNPPLKTPNPPPEIPPKPRPPGNGKGRGSVSFAGKQPTAAFPDNVLYLYEYIDDEYLLDVRGSFFIPTRPLKSEENLRALIQERLREAALELHPFDAKFYAETARPQVTFMALDRLWLSFGQDELDETTKIPFDVQWEHDWVRHMNQQQNIFWCYNAQAIADAQHSHTPPAWMMYVFPAMFLIFIGLFVWKCCSSIKKFLKRRRKRTDPRHLLKTPVAPALAHTWPRPRPRVFV